MMKLWILSVVSAVLLMQLALPTAASDVAEAINGSIRDQLTAFGKLLALDDGSHKEDLTKLIGLLEGALKNENVEEKLAIMNGLQDQFSPELNKYIGESLQQQGINDAIHGFIQFYSNLLASQSSFKTELEQTIAKLQAMLEITDFKEKEAQLMSLDKSFSQEFMIFLGSAAQPNIDNELKKTADFLESLLQDPEVKFVSEINALIAQTKAGLANASIDEKQKTLQEVTNPQSKELSEYLQLKFVERL